MKCCHVMLCLFPEPAVWYRLRFRQQMRELPLLNVILASSLTAKTEHTEKRVPMLVSCQSCPQFWKGKR